MTTARLLKLGNAQAVRIPARFRFDVNEVEVFKRGDELILRPKAETAVDMFARIRAKYGPLLLLLALIPRHGPEHARRFHSCSCSSDDCLGSSRRWQVGKQMRSFRLGHSLCTARAITAE